LKDWPRITIETAAWTWLIALFCIRVLNLQLPQWGGKCNLFFVYESILNLVAEILIT